MKECDKLKSEINAAIREFEMETGLRVKSLELSLTMIARSGERVGDATTKVCEVELAG